MLVNRRYCFFFLFFLFFFANVCSIQSLSSASLESQWVHGRREALQCTQGCTYTKTSRSGHRYLMHIRIAFPLAYSAVVPAHQELLNAPPSPKMHLVTNQLRYGFFFFFFLRAANSRIWAQCRPFASISRGEEAAIMSRHDSRTAPRSLLRKHRRNVRWPDLEASPTQQFLRANATVCARDPRSLSQLPARPLPLS